MERIRNLSWDAKWMIGFIGTVLFFSTIQIYLLYRIASAA